MATTVKMQDVMRQQATVIKALQKVNQAHEEAIAALVELSLTQSLDAPLATSIGDVKPVDTDAVKDTTTSPGQQLVKKQEPSLVDIKATNCRPREITTLDCNGGRYADVRFEGCRVGITNFFNCYFESVTFKNCTFRSVTFANIYFKNVTIKDYAFEDYIWSNDARSHTPLAGPRMLVNDSFEGSKEKPKEVENQEWLYAEAVVPSSGTRTITQGGA